MKVAFVNTTADERTAPARLALAVARALVEKGHQAAFFYGRGEDVSFYGRGEGADIPGVEFSRITTDAQVARHYFLSRLDDSEGLHSAAATRRLIDQLRRWQPDIVHLHNLHGHYLHVPRLLEALASMPVKVVFTLHDYWLLTGHCPLFEHCCPEAPCIGARETLTCPARSEYPRTLLSRIDRNVNWKHRALERFPEAVMVAVSRFMLSDIEIGTLLVNRKELIYNGVDTALFAPTSPTDGSLVVAAANHWDSRKGLDDLIALARHERMRASGRRIVVAGIIDKADLKRLPANVEAVGTLSPADLAALFSRASVVVNFSRAETFGMTMVEALACGTPVVAHRSRAAVELLGDIEGCGAALVDTRRTDGLIDAIDNMQRNADVELCRSYATRRFALESMIDDTFDLYSSML